MLESIRIFSAALAVEMKMNKFLCCCTFTFFYQYFLKCICKCGISSVIEMSSFFVSVSLSVTTCTHTIRWWLPTCLCKGRRRWAPRCSVRCSNTTTATERWATTSHPWVSNEAHMKAHCVDSHRQTCCSETEFWILYYTMFSACVWPVSMFNAIWPQVRPKLKATSLTLYLTFERLQRLRWIT